MDKSNRGGVKAPHPNKTFRFIVAFSTLLKIYVDFIDSRSENVPITANIYKSK
jgi:hypothetical protein